MEPDRPGVRPPGAPPGPSLDPSLPPPALPDPAFPGPPLPPKPRWRPIPWLITLILPFVVFGFTAARLARALGYSTPVSDISAQELFVRSLLVDVPLIVGTLFLARWLLHARPADLGLGRPRVAYFRYGLIFGFGLFLASIAIGLVQAAAVGKEQQAIAQALLGHRGLEALVLDIVAVAVLTPIAEELLFRGVFFGGVRQRVPFIPAAVATTAIFTLVHEPQAWPGVFVLGFGLALAYERTRSLWAPIAAHATVNGLPLVLLATAG